MRCSCIFIFMNGAVCLCFMTDGRTQGSLLQAFEVNRCSKAALLSVTNFLPTNNFSHAAKAFRDFSTSLFFISACEVCLVMPASRSATSAHSGGQLGWQ